MNIETFISQNSAWSLLFFGEAGLLFRIALEPIRQHRYLKWSDVGLLILWSVFVMTSCLLLFVGKLWPLEPHFLAFLIGLGAQQFWPSLEKGFNAAGPIIVGLLLRYSTASITLPSPGSGSIEQVVNTTVTTTHAQRMQQLDQQTQAQVAQVGPKPKPKQEEEEEEAAIQENEAEIKTTDVETELKK